MKHKNFQTEIGLRSILISTIYFIMASCDSSQELPTGSLYLGQTPPGNTPKIFPLSVKQGFFAAERIAISKDNREVFYSELKGYYPNTGEGVKKYTFSDGKWTGPVTLFEGYAAPALSVTGDTMYVETNFETFFSVKKRSGWTKPERILLGLDSAHYYHATGNGNYYISSKSGKGAGLSDWCKVSFNETDTTVLSLGRPLNTSGENLDFFVSQDESYMIVTNRPRFGISFRMDDGSWTNPRNFGPKIDFGLGSWGPWVTPDKKYLFYSTGTKPDYSDVYTYWIRIDAIIDSLRHSNLPPYVTSLIENQTAAVGQAFKFTVPGNIFVDEDSNDTLSYSAQMHNGDPIPAWIVFEPSTKTFTGTPVKAGEVTVFVVVTDPEKAIAYCQVKITISANPAK
jgi:hypothetical protein